ncbi:MULTISPECIES: NAD kinase [unclassified Leeuwenhoekiella]|mgnify:FL=1|uniref:NAD kinase n=1 Tax=unclassified Leeuwenhoekiella TaxID=2615029 RepID=UPI000C60E14B|nr:MULTISPECIES: NAD kinase [unclassified Leeuwenhoekiella]MAW96396.1 NAD kinase [Leeuwenhoekiella sp.]MBA81283.1 NAD kinase [Leeuwenhoekiella sp.]|tara:strand:+ start:33757 stop:34641 length:885 start_codon:yes stop_codon:yes gene_type:complete
MKVGIYGQFYHKNSGKYVQQLLDLLDQKGVEVIIEEHFLKLIHDNEDIDKTYSHFSTFEELDNSYDLFFSIGGDGTILQTITYVRDLNIPIVGINTGRLGFLATVNKEKLVSSVEEILKNNYSITERSLISIKSSSPNATLEELNFALNEITVSRKNSTSMISVETSLNGEHLTNYWADGLIISTPTGSTGYSLSCGGPVIMPKTSSFIITPIAPHNLNARPIVVPDSTEIKLKVSGREADHLVSLDSRIATLPVETEMTLTKAPFNIKLVLLEEDTFLTTLRKKLLWGEDKRN